MAHLAPLTVAVPIIAGALLVPVGRYLPRRLLDLFTVGAAASVVAFDVALLASTRDGRLVTWLGHFSPVHGFSVGIPLVVEPLNAGLALVAAVLTTAALLFSWRYHEDAEAHFHALMLLFLAGMSGFALTGDLFNMFVFFELTGAAAYALTGFIVEDRSSVQGALNFAIVNSLGAYVSLMGIGLLYARTGQLGFAQLGSALGKGTPDALVVAAFVLVCTGFLVKAAVAPFHFWTADAEAVAPSTVCAILSGAMVVLGVYAVGRLWFVVFADVLPVDVVRRALVVLGASTAIVGALMCFAQRHVKRLLAYSTIAHVGMFVLGLATLTPDGVTGAAVYVAGHAGVKASLFLLAGVMLARYGSVDEYDLHGRGRESRVVPWLFVMAALALASLPPFGTGLGKALAEEALTTAGYPWAPALFVLVSALTGGAVLRAVGRIYFGLGPVPQQRKSSDRDPALETSGEAERESREQLSHTPVTMLIPIVVLLLGGLAAGAVPGVAAAFGRAATRFVNGQDYIATVLDHPRVAAVAAPASAHWTWLGAGLGLLATLLAIAFAAIAIYADRLPSLVHRGAALARPPIRIVRRAHSGHVGDYVAWLFVGVAVLGGLVGWPLR